MSNYIEIHWTTGSLDEARRVSRWLVQERHVACAQISPWIESIYMWDNQLETTQECKVTFKTHPSKFDTVKDAIQTNTSYDVPEILVFNIEKGNEEYLNWMGESLLSQAGDDALSKSS